MPHWKIAAKRRVWLGLIVAVAVTGAWWFWNRSKSRTMSIGDTALGQQPLVRLARGSGDIILRERAAYFDPTPLFFPTEWNFGQGSLRESLKRQPGQVFGSFAPKFVYPEQEIKRDTPVAIDASGRLPEVVAAGNEAPLGGFGEGDPKPHPLPERSGYLEVKGLRDGKIIFAQPIKGIPVASADFAPLEFLVVISSAGLVAEPILTSGSAGELVDSMQRTYLAKSFRVGERLRPGIYRILIGP